MSRVVCELLGVDMPFQIGAWVSALNIVTSMSNISLTEVMSTQVFSQGCPLMTGCHAKHLSPLSLSDGDHRATGDVANNNYICYRQLYRIVPVLLHLFSNFIQLASELSTPVQLCTFQIFQEKNIFNQFRPSKQL